LAGGARGDEGGARGQVTTIFVSDPTAEAERVAQALRLIGYAVIDVPLSMLVARVAVQCPRVILIDADSDGALDAVSRMRELPDADDIDVLFLARPGGAVASPEEALAHEGSGLFVRPVDVPALVRKVEVLAGTPRVPSAPPTYGIGAYGHHASDRYEGEPSLPPPSMRALPFTPATPVPPAPGRMSSMRTPSEPPPAGAGSVRRVAALAPPVSSELQQLLAAAELRVQVRPETDSTLPTPEDEIEAVLPAELLAALDEPMESDDDDDDVVPPVASRSSHQGQAARDRTNDGGAPRTTGSSTGSGATPHGRRPVTADERQASPQNQAPYTQAGTQAGGTGGGISTTGGSERADGRALTPLSQGGTPVPPEAVTPPPSDASIEAESASSIAPVAQPTRVASSSSASGASGGESAFPAVLGPGDTMPVLARAIAARTGGSLCFIEGSIERRVVLREGDIGTAASTAEDESLLAFLGTRGELPRETVRRLSSKFPPFGRLAGAALVARGYLGQDQMWPILRAHAEWLLARVMQMQGGRLLVESRPPGRLAGEPSVFGGSPGAAVFVELVRRIVAPADALERLGGVGARLGEGRASAILAECALTQDELDRLHGAAGRSLGDVLGEAIGDARDRPTAADLATVVFALAQLEVLEVLPSVGDRPGSVEDLDTDDATIDAEALRERVRARSQLVDDGDYFAVLGVARDATGYEVRRAFLELRRAFDPSRMLTPEVADLAGDVRKITVVLEEAYEILKDTARRDRYRRAIEAVPGL
jgi:hypothetical protein